MEIKDIIIIGSGPAGLSAAIYASRAGYSTLMLEKTGPGGQIMLTDLIDNYPGFDEGVSGFDLQDKLFKQAQKFGSEMKSETVLSINKENNVFIIKTESSVIYNARSVIIASGAKYRLLGVEGESKLTSKGVSYCGTCDGPFYRNKEVVIIGGGDTALTEAVFIAKFAKKITIIHRKETFRAVNSLVSQIESLPNIDLLMNSVVTKINGDVEVTGVTIQNVIDQKETIMKTDGVFVFIGLDPNTSFVDKNILDNSKYVITNHNTMSTSIDGLFAAGDVRSETFRQVVCACSDGAKAAFNSGEYIDKLLGKSYV